MFKEKKFIKRTVNELRKTEGKALAAVSGGVDSAVSAALINSAGIDSVNLFINTGFLRNGEKEKVLKAYKKTNLKILYMTKAANFIPV